MVNLQVYATSICYTALHNNDTTWRNGVLATLTKGRRNMTDELHAMTTYEGEAGTIQAYLARPDIEEPRPAVIVIHEIVGLTDHIKRAADRFAEEGYVAFAPNLFS